jgi:hypothetical protein
LDTY